MEEIFQRVSIRRYLDKQVEEDKILQVLKAAMAAPSAGNQQPWEFYVVRNRETIRQLSLVSPYAKCAEKAPIVIVSCYRKEGLWVPEYAEIDMSIAMENLWLETCSLGLGGVWLGIAPVKDRMEKVKQIAGIDEHLEAFALFPMGYPAEERSQQDRFDETRIHYLR